MGGVAGVPRRGWPGGRRAAAAGAAALLLASGAVVPAGAQQQRQPPPTAGARELVERGRERLARSEEEVRLTLRRYAAEAGAPRALTSYCLSELAHRLAELEARRPDGPFTTRPELLGGEMGAAFLWEREDYQVARFQLCLGEAMRAVREMPPLRREGPPR